MVRSTRLANSRTFLVIIKPKDSLTTPRPIDADATASPAETRTSDGSEGKSSIHLARACLLNMIKWEMKATNWRNVAAEDQHLCTFLWECSKTCPLLYPLLTTHGSLCDMATFRIQPLPRTSSRLHISVFDHCRRRWTHSILQTECYPSRSRQTQWESWAP
jgi:hypothetical protein